MTARPEQFGPWYFAAPILIAEGVIAILVLGAGALAWWLG